ncbi:MAG: TlpA family protein disulfide reductase [Flavobacteriaceae bacterium]
MIPVKKKTLLNLLLFAFVLSFFVTPIGYHAKVWLNQLFSGSAVIVPEEKRERLPNYNWRLKDGNWDFFSFDRSKGQVVFINFWASWHLPCAAELADIQKLYDDYGDRVHFYLITNEMREPVQQFMAEKKFTFPVTYQIIGDPSPLELLKPPGSYILDREGDIVVKQKDIADWDNAKIRALLDELLAE